jgi:hypothetical protein
MRRQKRRKKDGMEGNNSLSVALKRVELSKKPSVVVVEMVEGRRVSKIWGKEGVWGDRDGQHMAVSGGGQRNGKGVDLGERKLDIWSG